MAEMVHITRDGEYIDGVVLNYPVADELVQFRKTYEGCHAWSKNNGEWYDTPAVSVGFARWGGCLEASVPECVRMAELMR